MMGNVEVCRAARLRTQCDTIDGLKNITTNLRLWMM